MRQAEQGVCGPATKHMMRLCLCVVRGLRSQALLWFTAEACKGEGNHPPQRRQMMAAPPGTHLSAVLNPHTTKCSPLPIMNASCGALGRAGARPYTRPWAAPSKGGAPAEEPRARLTPPGPKPAAAEGPPGASPARRLRPRPVPPPPPSSARARSASSAASSSASSAACSSPLPVSLSATKSCIVCGRWAHQSTTKGQGAPRSFRQRAQATVCWGVLTTNT